MSGLITIHFRSCLRVLRVTLLGVWKGVALSLRVFVQNALISTYCLCGEVDMARGIFYMSCEDDDGLHELFRIKAVDDDLHELFPEYLVQMLALPDTFMDEGLEVIPKSQAPREETTRVGNLEEGTPQEGRPHEHSQDDMSLISNSIPQR
ncbi:hypothetical protein CUMW_157530 [Citrus unshiu]|nr:hypothetical protein CUMW_157530 [Citrus unshiu]